MQLLRACLVGGDDIGRPGDGIVEGLIGSDEECDVIHNWLLRYCHCFMASPSPCIPPERVALILFRPSTRLGASFAQPVGKACAATERRWRDGLVPTAILFMISACIRVHLLL